MAETHGQVRSLNSLPATISSLSGSMAQNLTETEEEKMMRRFAVNSNMTGSDADAEADADADAERSKLLLFPKPRRLGRAAIPEFLKTLRCSKHSQTVCIEESRSGMMNQIMKEKEQDLRECDCIPPCYPGPPPCRTDNPLVNDVEFVHQMQLLSRFSIS